MLLTKKQLGDAWEDIVAKVHPEGKKVPNSGSGTYNKGDVRWGKTHLVECKSRAKQFGVSQQVWETIRRYAVKEGRDPVIAIQLHEQDVRLAVIDLEYLIHLLSCQNNSSNPSDDERS